MQINLTGHHVDITEAMRNYVESRFERLARHLDHVLDAQVVLAVEKLRHSAEARIHVSGGTIHAEATEEDMYAAIDALSDKLDRQILKYKEKKNNYRGTTQKATESE